VLVHVHFYHSYPFQPEPLQARARGVSWHTKSAAGTKIKDSLMTISQTAKKLGVNTYEYILDRVSCEFKLLSLAELIQQKSQADRVNPFA
jgi:hypothetical protein